MAKLVRALLKSGKKTIAVQFNPTELSLTRGIQTENDKPINNNKDENKKIQTTVSDSTTLSMTLYLDAYMFAVRKDGAKLPKNADWDYISDEKLTTYKDALNTLSNRIKDIALLLKTDNKTGTVPEVNFVWGTGMNFTGKVRSMNTTYKMFDPTGKPTRVTIQLTLVGEETSMVQNAQSNQQQSSDCTKTRQLMEGDQMCMLAEEEYGDPSQWKNIAKENDIQNPRTDKHSKELKLPSKK